METLHKTGCVLYPQNCGLEVAVENNRIVKVRGDKGNVRSLRICLPEGDEHRPSPACNTP
jgi:hypothetical protein